MALAEIDRVIAAGMRFGCVLADAGYGLSAPFRQGLTARKLTWAVGIPRHLKVYPADGQRFFASRYATLIQKMNPSRKIDSNGMPIGFKSSALGGGADFCNKIYHKWTE